MQAAPVLEVTVAACDLAAPRIPQCTPWARPPAAIFSRPELPAAAAALSAAAVATDADADTDTDSGAGLLGMRLRR